mmetsp:Transcript_13139/g.15081  ORF Transcript_13139/g.15081 Transcript_13139/m.15081 type:complete len:145 (+) Transcript_13139:1-435(+)
MAIFKMNQFEVDGARITASEAKEHGVLLSSQLKRYLRREAGSSSDGPHEERWSHDKFEMLQRGEDPFQRRGRGRGRGGRGGHRGGRADDTEASFERYISARDEALGIFESPTGDNHVATTAAAQESAPVSAPVDTTATTTAEAE